MTDRVLWVVGIIVMVGIIALAIAGVVFSKLAGLNPEMCRLGCGCATYR